MRIIFMGYHNIGYACLEALIELSRELGDEIVAVVTHADDPRENIWFASVRQLAFENYLPVYQPANPNDPAFVAAMQALQPDWLFSCYYRHMLKQPVLDLPPPGGLESPRQPAAPLPGPLSGELGPGPRRDRNRHNPPLHGGQGRPGRHRGPAPHSHHPGRHRRHALGPDDRGGGAIVPGDLPAPAKRPGPARFPQDHAQASYFGGRRPEDGKIDWRQPATAIYNLMRAVTHPYPGAFTDLAGTEALHLERSGSGRAIGGPGRPRPDHCRAPWGRAPGGHGRRALPHHPGPMGGRAGIFGAGTGHLGTPGGGKIFVGAHLRVRPQKGGHMGPPLQWNM